MPAFNNRTVVEIARGVKAFLNLEAGVTRGRVPSSADSSGKDDRISRLQRRLAESESRLKARERQIEELRSPARGGDAPRLMPPERLVWIFCASRSGSTWLYQMLDELEDYSVWHEPMVGQLFGSFYEKNSHRGGKHFIMGGDKRGWIGPIRSFVLQAAGARFPERLYSGYLAVKEPGSAVGAPLLTEALPESRMIFLVRDPRDVVASNVDAYKKGSWFRERRERAQSGAAGRFAAADEDPDSVVTRSARNYALQVGKSKQAYDAHAGPKTLVTYEELIADTLGTMRRLHEELGVEVNQESMMRAVEKHSWENIPEEKRGQGKFYRKGQPGSWREDLTPDQVEIVEKITAPLLATYYADPAQ